MLSVGYRICASEFDMNFICVYRMFSCVKTIRKSDQMDRSCILNACLSHGYDK